MQPQPIAPDAKKILVVDDNCVILRAMTNILSGKGYRVSVAESGAETITLLRKDKPDLILMDLDFPLEAINIAGALRDGFIIIDWARRMCHAENIPVIIISSTDPDVYMERAHAAGILTLFKKPVDHGQLLEAIHSVLGEGRLAASASA